MGAMNAQLQSAKKLKRCAMNDAGFAAPSGPFAKACVLRNAVRQLFRKHRPALAFSAGLCATGLAVASDVCAESVFPPVVELSSLDPANGGDGSAGFIVQGINERDYSGTCVSNAGDVNGDGIDDLVVGAFRADPRGQEDAGATYVVFGRATGFPAVFELRSLTPAGGGDGSEGFLLNGIDAGDDSGYSVSTAGDLNGDGTDDLVIGAPYGRLGFGESYVVFGRTTGFAPVLDLRSLHPAAGGDGSAGFIVRGIDSGDHSGWSVSGAGDVNGDFLDDLVVGAPTASRTGPAQGESYIVFGQVTGFPPLFELRSLHPGLGGDGSVGVILFGAVSRSQSGRSVSGARDVNGDGTRDLIIGAYAAQPGGLASAGQSYVLFGRAAGFPAAFDLGTLDPSGGGDGGQGFILTGIRQFDFSGLSVSDAGDVSGDGIDDLLIGAPNADAGETYVVFGRATGFPPLFELRSLHPASGGDGTEGLIVVGIDTGDSAGISVSGAGDVNGDGIDDFLVGAHHADPGLRMGAGATYVVFGRSTGFPPLFDLRTLAPAGGGDGSAGLILTGIGRYSYAGLSVSAAGDVNGDGIGDLIIGALSASPDGRYSAGESYVVFGRAAVTAETQMELELGSMR